MNKHIGETEITKEGLTARIVRWHSRERVQIELLETHERKWVSYIDFKKGRIKADFVKFPAHTDCTFGQAKFFTIAILSLIFTMLGALAYKIFV